MSFVYVHMIEMTVFEEEAYEIPYTLIDREVDIVCVTKEPLSYVDEIDMLEAWFKHNPFGLSGVLDNTLEYAAKLVHGDECVYLLYNGRNATLSLTTYKQVLW